VTTPIAFQYIPWRGATCDRKLVEFLKILERRLGYEIDVIKGHDVASNDSVSATTHNGGGVADLTPFDAERKLKAIIDLGGWGWIREPSPSWSKHIHFGITNHGNLDPQARAQQESFQRGRNGLVGDAVDPNKYRPKVPDFSYQKALDDNQLRRQIQTHQLKLVQLRGEITYRP
jgi:hypothetical protein